MYRKSFSRVFVILGVVLFILVMSLPVSQAEAKKTTIRALSAWPKTTFMVQNFTRFINRVNGKAAKMFPGELEIQYKGGPEVISFKEQVEAVRTGLIDMVFTATSYYTSIIPVGDGFSASAFKPWEEREKGVFDFMQKIHAERANAYFLSRMGSGIPFQIYSNKLIKTAADLKGMKLRGSPTLIPFLKKIGANPIMMAPGGIYTALERGVVDGFVWPAAQIRECGARRPSPSMWWYRPPPTSHRRGAGQPGCLEKASQSHQDLLIESAKEDEFRTVVRALEYIPRENAQLKKLGVQFLDLPDADVKKLADAAISALWEVVIKRDPQNGPKFKAMISK